MPPEIFRTLLVMFTMQQLPQPRELISMPQKIWLINLPMEQVNGLDKLLMPQVTSLRMLMWKVQLQEPEMPLVTLLNKSI
jgi:hypothetical protein